MTRGQDKFYWKLTRHGEYTVKSGYELTKQLNLKNRRSLLDKESSISRNRGLVCKEIWKLNVKY